MIQLLIIHKATANSPLGETFRPFENFERSQTHSLASRPKFSKEAKALTADTRILGESQGDSAESMESTAESLESSLRDSAIAESWQSTVENNPHEVPPNLAPLRGAEKERKGGSSASALLELEAENSETLPLKACRRLASIAKQKQRSFFSFGSRLTSAVGKACRGAGQVFKNMSAALFAKKSDYINENISAESRRSERVETFTKNAESHIESQKDSSDSIESAKDSSVIDCHESQSDSRNDASLSSLRGDLSTKQSIKTVESQSDSTQSSDFDLVDCHDSATQNLAKTAKDDSAESRRSERVESNAESAESFTKSTESHTQSHKDSTDSSRYRKYLHNIRHSIVAKSRPFSLQPFDILLMLVIVLWAYALYLSLKSGRADYCGSFDIMSGLSYLKATFKSVRGAFFTLFFVAVAFALCSARFRIIVLGGILWIVVIIVFYTLTVSRCGATWYLMSGLFLSMLCVLSVFVSIILRRFKALKSIVALVILVAFLQPFEPYKERPRSSYEFFKSHSQSWIDLAINADKHNKKELTIYVPKDFPHYHWESWFFPAFSRTLKNYGLVRGEMEIEFRAME